MRIFPRSIRGRLWMALAILSIAILGISGLTWTALQRVDARLQDLHSQSLSQVAQAIDLSKRTSDLAATAPYLLNQRSNFLIEQEGEKLVGILRRVREEWPEGSATRADRAQIVPVTQEMENGIIDLVDASRSLDNVQARIRARVATLSSLRDAVTDAIESPDIRDAERLIWWTLQSMNSDALNAAYAENLIGVGEEQRHYQRQHTTLPLSDMTDAQTAFLQNLEAQVTGDTGLFELRRVELGVILRAQNALFRIRRDANRVNELASGYAREAEVFLTAERSASSSTIQLTRISVVSISLIGLACALAAALFVSRYVAFNISRVSEAMVRLANGDRSSVLPRRVGAADEIGDLFRSFRSFRANALRLDRSNRQLDQRNALFEKVFANISDGIAITDATGRLTATNPAFGQILRLGDDAPVVNNLADWLWNSKFGEAAQASGLTVAHRGHVELTAQDGQILELRASRLPDEGRVWLLSDVTEQRSIAARLEQIDRIETLGKLAGDTAHDFGNILGTIRTHAHLLDAAGAAGAAKDTNIAAIENAVEFGASLTDRLLAFARKQPLIPEIVDLNVLIEGLIELVEIGLKPNVAMDVTYADAPVLVRVDPGQLESAILNLILNANNAIEGDGTIQIAVSRIGQDDARLSVIDTGTGMSEEIRQKAIEPFFTTRSAEGGTGLGLSIVYGFINQTGGSIEIQSTPNKGTTVQISLPLAQDMSHRQAGAVQTALLVDDNPDDRKATELALDALGISTVSCGTLPEANNALAAHRFDWVISDLDLGPGPNGLEFLRDICGQSGQARRLLISGKVVANETLPDNISFLEKPVTSKSLAHMMAASRALT